MPPLGITLFLAPGFAFHRQKPLHVSYDIVSIDREKNPLPVMICLCFIVGILSARGKLISNCFHLLAVDADDVIVDVEQLLSMKRMRRSKK